MNSTFRFCLLTICLTSLAHALFAGDGRGINAAAYGKLPLTFAWRGPGAAEQPFAANVSGHRLAFAASGEVIERALGGSYQSEATLQFVGARANVQPRAAGPQSGTANYFTGSDPEGWRTGVPLFQAIKYANLYPGIDLIYYGNQDRLEYDLVVGPGASWRSIRLAFGGAQKIEIDRQGNLRLQTSSGWVTHGRPAVYQSVQGIRRKVSGQYVFSGGHEVGFDIGAHDPSRPLIIDPTLAFASYLGGSGDDYGNAVAIDSSGCAYVVGETGSTNFPTLGPEQAWMGGDTDVFVTKWNAAGTGVVYSTYIGGSNRDAAMGVAVDSAGNAYVTGFTYSGNFPITSGAQRTSFAGASKAFVLKLNASGNGLIYSTFLGGSGNDYGAGIAVDAAGEAHIAGYTASVDFPATTGAFQRYYGGGTNDGFLAKLNAAGSALIYATYLGGIANDTAAGVALDPSGNIYVTGQTQSTNFPTVNPLQPTGSERDAFVVKMNASGQVIYSTYLGGTGLTSGTAIAADASGNAYVTGSTDAPDFPVTANAYQAVNGGSYDAFVATLNSYGSSILGATYLGGSGSDSGYGIALDGTGNVYIAGSTNSINFPTYAGTQSTYSGGGDAFVAEFNNQLTSLVYSTYFGGSGNDLATGIAVDSTGDAYITGWTSSGGSGTGLPTTPGAFQPIGMGGIDAFLAKFAVNGGPLACTTSTPQVLTVQAGGASQLVGDFLLSCTGGTLGTQVTAGIQATLNTSVTGTQPEVFIGTNTNPIWGTASGNSGILFQGISFAAPGPSANITLRITNVWLNLSSIAAGGQVIMTVAVLNANPSLTVAPTQQTVAIAQSLPVAQLQQLVLSTASAPANCAAPPPASGFPISDAAAMAWLLVGNVSAGDVARVDWSAPFGGIYQSHSLTATSSGTQCLWDSMNIAGAAEPMAGAWNVNVYWNGALMMTVPFTISAVGLHQLILQNQTTGQVDANYYAGVGGTTLVGWACLSCGINTTTWRAVALADFDGNGVPDLIYQNTQTGQVNVDYYGGAGGTTFIGWACLSCGIDTTQWRLVAAADFDGNGTPALVYQNTQTHQVNVDYYSYSSLSGNAFIGWACLSCGINTTQWQLVAVADFDGNGTPDLVYQNTQTHQVNVDYYSYSSSRENAFTGWECLSCAINTTQWQVVAVADFDGNGTPDLVYQNTQTHQVNVDYYSYSSSSRNAFIGWACLNANPVTGWSVVSAE
jgi:hypothetical protein